MWHDLRYGLRMLAKSPAFTAVAVLSLALGIGANTAIFSLVNALLFAPLPVREPGRLVAVFTLDQRNPGNLPLSHLNYKDLRDQTGAFDGLAAVAFAQMNWASGTESEQIQAQVVSGNYFSVLGVQPDTGRAIGAADDDKPTAVAVLNHAFWERSLGSDPNIVGRTLTLNRTPFTIVGVAPRGFTGTTLGGGPAVWVPMSMHDVAQPNFPWYEQRRGLFITAVGRLAAGVSAQQADANLRTVFAQLERAYPDDNQGRSAAAVPLLDARLNPFGRVGAPIAHVSMILTAVVAIVLLIACANVANLLLARSAGRRREIAIRLALGAGRVRLIRQLLTESVLLAGAGAALGLGLAWWTLALLASWDLPLPLPLAPNANLALDGRVLVFTGLLSLATGLIFGLAPALQASKPELAPVLKNDIVLPGAAALRFAGLTLRQALVVSQVALSLMAVVAAGLFLRSLQQSQGIDTGFETRGVLVVNLNLGREGYTPERGRQFYRDLAERTAALPGVRRAAVAQSAPLAGGLLRSISPEGADTTTRDRVLVRVNSVTPGYLETLGVPLLRGRDFANTDDERAPRVIIVNETMAARFWPGQDAVGKRLTFFGDPAPTTIVGVAKDSKYVAVAEDPTPFIYQPMAQNYSPAATLHVRSDGAAAGFVPLVRRQVQELDPTLSVFDARTLEDQVAGSLAPLRSNVVLLAVFGGVALALAAIGLYGVASYTVSNRKREIGVRMALGARPAMVVRMVLVQGLLLVGAGLAAGVIAVLAVTTVAASPLRGLLPATSVRDPWLFAAAALLLGAVAVLASGIPAWRAARIDPLLALRAD